MLAALVALMAEMHATDAATLFPSPVYAVGTAPWDVATADFNGDGLVDLVVGNRGSNDISILLGTRPGPFGPQARFPAGADARAVVVTDFDSDDRADVATANYASNDVSVFFGNGDGTLQPEARYAAGTGPRSMAVGDFNGDQWPDLALANDLDLSIILNAGQGVFRDDIRIPFASTTYQTVEVLARDFNGDARDDLAVILPFGVSIALAVHGSRLFDPLVSYPIHAATSFNTSATMIDANADGRDDLVLCSDRAPAPSDGVPVLLGRGDGTFDAGSVPGTLYGHAVRAGDLNADARPELATVISYAAGGPGIRVHQNGGGSFLSSRFYAAGWGPGKLAVADFDGDGVPDMAVTDQFAGRINILDGIAGGTFGPQIRLSVDFPRSLAAADFTRDGTADLAVASDVYVNVYPSLGGGSFGAPVRTAAAGAPGRAATADFNGDGLADLALPDLGRDQLLILLSRGDGAFQVASALTTGRLPTEAAAGDLNADGRLDIVLVNQLSDDLSVFLGHGDGSFEPETRYVVGHFPYSLAVGDLDRDGVPDVVVLNTGSADLTIRFGAGDGTFGAPSTLAADAGTGEIQLADMNGDGILDIAASSGMTGEVSIWTGAGNGSFGEPARQGAPLSGASLAVADVDDDGRPDLLTGGRFQVSVWLGRGDGTVEPAVSFLSVNDMAVVAADLDGDGDTDVAHADYQTGSVAVLINISPKANRPPVARAQDVTVECTLAATLDGSASIDPDSSFGTHDDIVLFEWFLDLGGTSETLLGTGERLTIRLPVGAYTITLRVTDRAGLTGADEALVVFRDSTGPFLDCTGHTAVECDCPDGVYVRVTATARDSCDGSPDISNDRVAGSDASGIYAPGLTAVHFSAIDDSGNVASCTTTVWVGGPSGIDRMFPDRLFPVGDGATHVVVEDFDRDGFPDVVVANGWSEDLSYLRGLGRGVLDREVRLPLGGVTSGLLAGDWNGDGRPDLAVSTSSGEIAILLGTEEGSFGPVRRFPGATFAGAAAAGLLDGDAAVDLVLVDNGNDEIALLAGRGDGTFAAPVRIPTAPRPRAIVVEDFNRDGRDDIALSHTTGIASVLLGRGDGSFVAGAQFAVGAGPQNMIAADPNEDGNTDLITVNNVSDDVSVLLGRGDGTFADQMRFPVADDPRAMVARDYDSDGHVDLAVVSYLSRDITVLGGRGDGGFDLRERVPGLSANQHIAAGDFNGDNRPDLVVPGPTVSETTGAVAVMINRGALGFQDVNTHVAASGVPRALRVGDFNRDGRKDLVWSDSTGSGIVLALGLGQGGFSVPTSVSTIAATTIDISDFNEDGSDDIVVLQPFGVSLLVSLGDGTFSPLSVGPFRANSMASGDFNADQHKDLVINDQFVGLRSLLGRGDGSFTVSSFTAPPLFGPGILVADFNSDGHQDLVLRSGPSTITLRHGRGDGTFGPPLTVITDLFFSASMGYGDFNADGLTDLVVTQQQGFAVLPGSADGTLGPPLETRLRVYAGYFVPADFDLDGQLDITFASADALLVLLGLGDGTFGPTARFRVAGVPESLVAADFNGDALIDLAALSSYPPGVTVVLNRGVNTGPNRPPVALTVGTLRAECASPAGTLVRLDGSASSDPDSTPGTNDDIVRFEWFEDFGNPSERFLGLGMILDVTFGLGDHAVTLRVVDSANATSTASLAVHIVDESPPALAVVVTPNLLWPPNHRMVEVLANVRAEDACGPAVFVLAGIESNEPDDAPGGSDGITTNDIQDAAVGTADVTFRLRAERDAQGVGRVYRVTYVAQDVLGQAASISAQVDVPICGACPPEPLLLSLTHQENGTLITWTEMVGASAYRAARGDVRALADAGEYYDLGLVDVLAEMGTSESRTALDAGEPAPGEAFFYVVEALNGTWTGYGTESAAKERRPRASF